MGAKLPKELRLNNVGFNNCPPRCFYTPQWRCPYLAYLVCRWILAFYTVGAFIYMVVIIQQVHFNHPEQSHTPMVYLTSWAYLTLVCHFVVSAVITSFCNPNLKFETELSDFENPDIQLKSFKVTPNDTMTALDERIIHDDNARTMNSATECNCQGVLEKYRGSNYLRDEQRDTMTSDTGASPTVNQGEWYPAEETGRGFHVVTNISNHGRISGDLTVDAEIKLKRFETDGTESTNRADYHPLNITIVQNPFNSGDVGPPRDHQSRFSIPCSSNIAIEDSAVERGGMNNRYKCGNNKSNGCDLERKQELQTDNKIDHVLPWYCKLSWVLGNISSTFALVVSIVYFGFVFKESFRDTFNDVNTHILNTVFVLLDSFISARPTRLLHLVYSLGFGLVYLLFSVVFWAADHRNVIYPGLTDWNNPGIALAVGGAIALLIVIFHSINFGMYKLRLRIFHKFCKRQTD